MKKEELIEYINDKTVIIDNALRQLLTRHRGYIKNLDDGVMYALGLDEREVGKRGKRLRPVLCLLSCEMLGGEIKRALPFALAIELMHNYCLVHDDIEDGDKIRRGRPAVWARYGLAHGINIGDYILVQLLRSLLSQKNRLWDESTTFKLIELMVETLEHTLRGQSLDINARSSRSITLKEYLKIVSEKTGYYLSAPILGGAIIAGVNNSTLVGIRKYGRHIGPLFQIMDDIIDLTTGKGRDEIGSDIKEGKRSFMVVYVLERCTGTEAEEIFSILDKPRQKTTRRDIRRILAIFEKYKAIKGGEEFCQKLKRKSQQALNGMPARLRSALSAFAELLAERIR